MTLQVKFSFQICFTECFNVLSVINTLGRRMKSPTCHRPPPFLIVLHWATLCICHICLAPGGSWICDFLFLHLGGSGCSLLTSISSAHWVSGPVLGKMRETAEKMTVSTLKNLVSLGVICELVKIRAVFWCHKRRWSRVRSDPLGIREGFLDKMSFEPDLEKFRHEGWAIQEDDPATKGWGLRG